MGVGCSRLSKVPYPLAIGAEGAGFHNLQRYVDTALGSTSSLAGRRSNLAAKLVVFLGRRDHRLCRNLHLFSSWRDCINCGRPYTRAYVPGMSSLDRMLPSVEKKYGRFHEVQTGGALEVFDLGRGEGGNHVLLHL